MADKDSEGNVLPAHVTETYMWSGGIAPIILNLNIGSRWVVSLRHHPLFLRKRTPVRTE